MEENSQDRSNGMIYTLPVIQFIILACSMNKIAASASRCFIVVVAVCDIHVWNARSTNYNNMWYTGLYKPAPRTRTRSEVFFFRPFFVLMCVLFCLATVLASIGAHNCHATVESWDVDNGEKNYSFLSKLTRNKNNARRVSGLSSALPAELINVLSKTLYTQELDESEVHEGPTSERCPQCPFGRAFKRPC